MSLAKWATIYLIFLYFLAESQAQVQMPTKVGNYDDGNDLHHYELVKSKKILKAQKQALALLKKLNIKGVKFLGNLAAEVRTSKLYISKDGLTATQLLKMGAYRNDGNGIVYARTMPRPHAATRFFPWARDLSVKQLVTLQIHEALHRAMPMPYNLDEVLVSEIAQAITNPGASFDSVQLVVDIQTRKLDRKTKKKSKQKVASAPAVVAPKTSKIHKSSIVSLEGRQYSAPTGFSKSNQALTLERMYLMSSVFYPFAGKAQSLGLGMGISILDMEKDYFVGPIEFSAFYVLWSQRGFEVEPYVLAHINTLSHNELKNSLFGRDSYKIGLKLNKTYKEKWIWENSAQYTFGTKFKKTINKKQYEYQIGGAFGIDSLLLRRIKNFYVGANFHLLLADNFIQKGPNGTSETGRIRILGVGPNIEYRISDWSIGLSGRFITSKTQDVQYDNFGDLLGQGAGQGQISLTLKAFL